MCLMQVVSRIRGCSSSSGPSVASWQNMSGMNDDEDRDLGCGVEWKNNLSMGGEERWGRQAFSARGTELCRGWRLFLHIG